MELRQLKGFIAVATFGNFSEAARRLHLTQPALSRQVKGLETEFEVPLLKRKVNRVELTDEGKIFFEEAQDIIRDLNEVVQRIRARIRTKPLKVGYTAPLAYGLLPVALSRFLEEPGAIHPELLDMPPQNIAAMARSGELDVAILPRDLDREVPSFQWTPWRQIIPWAIMSKKHFLAKQKAISPSELHNLPLHALARSEFPDYGPRLRGMFRPHRVRLNFKHQSAKSVAAIFACLEADTGLAVLAEGAVHILPNTLVARPIRPGIGTIPIMVGTVASNANPWATRLVKHLLKAATEKSEKRNGSTRS